MLAKFTVITLIAFVINLSIVLPLYAQTQNDREAKNLQKVKTNVAKLFGNKRGKTTVKYKDGTKIKGYITEVKDDFFSISESKSASIVSIKYDQVQSVSQYSFPTAAKIAIGVAAGIGVLIIIVGVGLSSSIN